MKTLLIPVSAICLLLNIVPAFLVFLGIITLDLNKTLMLIGTVGWFLTAPYWMNQKKEEKKKVNKNRI